MSSDVRRRNANNGVEQPQSRASNHNNGVSMVRQFIERNHET